MTHPDVGPTTTPLDVANDNRRAEAVARRFLLGAAIYVLAATFGWAAVGVLVTLWVFER
jgi:hypothetical protein